jgi:hypothetical protein
LSENPQEVVPTTTEYITATGKQALSFLESVGGLIPVPLIQEAIGVALKIIQVCEVCMILPRKGCEMMLNILFCQNVSAVGGKVKELQDRVCHLMVVIVDNVTSKNESHELIVNAVNVIERDIKDLLGYF